VTVRLSEQILRAIDAWGVEQQEPVPSRSEAIRQLVEVALGSLERRNIARDKAAGMAARTVDSLADQLAPVKDRAERKRRLIKGPTELRNQRGPKSKRKKVVRSL
jgi:hypothetical protein